MAKQNEYAPRADHRIVVLSGKERLLQDEDTAALERALHEAHGGVEVFRFGGEQVELATVLDELRSYGLMQSYKLVIVDAADKFLAPPKVEDDDEDSGDGKKRKADSPIRRALERYAESPVDHATLLLRAETWRAGNLDKLIAKCGVVHKYKETTDATATAWCVSRAKSEYDAKLERPAAALLVERLGTGYARLDSEVAKLAALAPAGSAITAAMVKEMVGLSREEKAWDVQGAVMTGSPGAALRKVDEMIEVSQTPNELLMWALLDLARKLHAASRMLQEGASPAMVSKTMRLWGSTQQPILTAARKRSPRQFAQLLQHGIRADSRAKSGLATPRSSIEGFAVALADIVK